MSRLEKFEALASHAWHRKTFAKLAARDVAFCRDFLTRAEGEDQNAFEAKVNRLFLDREKPRAWKEILELLASCS